MAEKKIIMQYRNSTGYDTVYPKTTTDQVDGLQTALDLKENADNTILKQANVINNVTTESTIYPLSATQGKVLQTEINNLKNIGRFLAILDASAGTVSSQPSGSVGDTYNYKVGDYYRVGASGNYTPKSTSTYTIDSTSGSSNFESGATTYNIGDVIYCSNLTSITSTWVKQASSGGGTVQDVTVDGVTTLEGGTAVLNLGKFGITATSSELNILDGILASTQELNYTDGVTSNIQTQLNSKEDKSNKVISISSSSTNSEYPSAKCVYDNIVTKQTKLTQGSNITISNTLPSGYTELEYITSTGLQYIDSGIQAQSGIEVDASIMFDSTSNESYFIGVYENDTNPSLRQYMIASIINRWRWSYPYTTDTTETCGATSPNVWYDIKAKQLNGVQELKVNDVVVASSSSPSNYIFNYNLILFALSVAGGAAYNFSGKVKAVKIFVNEELARNFIPAKNSSNVVGLYDIVTQTFFTNTGAGSFIAGPEVVNTEIISVTGTELLNNKVTSISSSSTDTEYPSAKCVYDYVQGSIADAIGGNY